MKSSKTLLLVGIISWSCTGVSIAQVTVKEGKKLYSKYDCVACHGNDGTTPFSLTGQATPIPVDSLEQYIKNPGKFSNTRMPSFDGIINEGEYPALIAYVQRLRKAKKR